MWWFASSRRSRSSRRRGIVNALAELLELPEYKTGSDSNHQRLTCTCIFGMQIYLESATNSFQDKFHMTLPEHVHGLSPHHAASLGLHHAAAGGIDSHAASNRCPSVWEPAAVVSRSRLSSMDGGKQLVCVWDLDGAYKHLCSSL